MSLLPDATARTSSYDAELLVRLFGRADRILIKKLSNNDRDWSHDPGKHQAGVYIPHEQRDGGFFPQLEVRPTSSPDANEIREAFFTTVWPQNDSEAKRSRLVHYTSKGQETHLTRLPKSAFSELLPASFLVMSHVQTRGEVAYECVTIDSGSDEAALLADLFDLAPDFLIGEFDPDSKKAEEQQRILAFADEVVVAWKRGETRRLLERGAALPDPPKLALLARNRFLDAHSLKTFDPFSLECPGNVLREISRKIEWNLFRDFQRRERSVELVRLVMGDGPANLKPADIIRRLITEFPAIDALMLSASQQRKSRAGYSYEYQIEAILEGGGIPFEKQVIIGAKKRPDFVLPSMKHLNSKNVTWPGLILSAKTTLRERWKQVEREKGHYRLYLTTVDENVAGNVIEDMASFGVILVIPESLKEAKETEYDGHENVVSFKEFTEEVIRPALPGWTALAP